MLLLVVLLLALLRRQRLRLHDGRYAQWAGGRACVLQMESKCAVTVAVGWVQLHCANVDACHCARLNMLTKAPTR